MLLLVGMWCFLLATRGLPTNHAAEIDGLEGLAPAPGNWGSVPKRTFNSPNGKHRLVLEVKAVKDIQVTLAATMSSLESSPPKTLWTRDFRGDDLTGMRNAPVIAEDGSFFLIKRFIVFPSPEWALVGKDFDRPVTELDRQTKSFFPSEEPRIFHLEKDATGTTICVWDRDADLWTAFRASDGAPLKVTPDMTARWNEATRAKILNRIAAHRSKAIAKKIEAASPTLTRLAAGDLLKATTDLKEIDFEFLAIRRDPRDRIIFERLLDSKSSDIEKFAGIFCRVYSWGRATAPMERAWLHSNSADLMAADRFLAVFDQKAERLYTFDTSERRIFSSSSFDKYDTEPRRYLGEVAGSIQFSTPLREPTGVVRLYLIPGETTNGWEKRACDVIEDNRTHIAGEPISDAATFHFSTVLPGKYFAKVMWDRRAPYTDAHKAGPGDYESAFFGPFEVVPGSVVTNIALSCTNRASAGEEYYAADDLAAKKWENGEITSLSTSGNEVFNAPAERWIIQTNAIAKGRTAWFTAISLAKEFVCRPASRPLPAPLYIYARTRGPAGSNELTQIHIVDEHGCAFAPARLQNEPGMITFYLASFPRAAATFRLVGSDEKGAQLFDFTLTNLVRTAPEEFPVKTPPFELTINDVQLKIEEVRLEWGEEWNARLKAQFVQNGIATTNWFLMDTRFHDAQGNACSPTNFCSKEPNIGVSLMIRQRPARRSRPLDAVEMMRNQARLATEFLNEAIPVEFAIPRESLLPRIE